MPQKHYIEVKANEEAYAAASGTADERAEAAATSYPVQYPEPFATLGCGYGQAGAFVVRAGQEAANEAGVDWECTNQIHVQFTLFGGTEQQYAQFEKALQERLELVKKWVEFRPKYAIIEGQGYDGTNGNKPTRRRAGNEVDRGAPERLDKHGLFGSRRGACGLHSARNQ